jgi:U3 small nucleolar RNA-associated protein 7
MQSLVAKADALRSYKKRKIDYKPHPRPADDPTLNSVTLHTVVPKSLRPTSPEPKESRKYSHVSDKKLRAELIRQSAQSARSKALVEDSAFLLAGKDAGKIEVEGELDRTWRAGQDEIVKSSGQEAAKGRREFNLDGGPYRCRYTRNGRYLSQFSVNAPSD